MSLGNKGRISPQVLDAFLQELVSGFPVALFSVLFSWLILQTFVVSHIDQKKLTLKGGAQLSHIENDLHQILHTQKNAAFLLVAGVAVSTVIMDRIWRFGNSANSATTRRRALMLIQWTSKYLFLVNFFCFSLFFLTQYHYNITLRPLLDRYRWTEEQQLLGQTYYERHCTAEDLSTIDPNDLVLKPEWDSTKAAENILIHGASVFPGLIDRETAENFRNFTLVKNSNLKKKDFVFVMNTYTKKTQTRWSFAFSAHDHPSVPMVLRQVISNDRLRETLELFLGPDPAMIKMQTITCMYGAEHQSWHPDVNAKSSYKSHARNFMMHFSLFIPLQDTPPKMGATGVCPGSQYCTTMEPGSRGLDHCGQVVSGQDANGNPAWLAGDAVLMNQNTWHRGWEHTLRGGPHRAMIVITFTSRPRIGNGRRPERPFYTPLPQIQPTIGRGCDISKARAPTQQRQRESNNIIFSNTDVASNVTSLSHLSGASDDTPQCIASDDARNFPIQSWNDEEKLKQAETRVLSLGTPLTSFGHTMYDMYDSLYSMSTFISTLRFFGLYKPSQAHWGWDYMSSVFSRIATETHKYKKEDLTVWLNSQRSSGILNYILVKYFLFSSVPATTEDRGIWDVWYTKSLKKVTSRFQHTATIALCTFAISSLLLLLVPNPTVQPMQSRERGWSRYAMGFLKSLWGIGRSMIIILLFVGILHYGIEQTLFVKEIKAGIKTRTAFPKLEGDWSTQRFDNGSYNYIVSRQVPKSPLSAQEPVLPGRDDVLIGSRFDSLHLRIVNQFLDYHTGNKVWRKLVHDISELTGFSLRTYQLQPQALQASMIRAITDNINGRFLTQSASTGNFSVLPKEQSFRYTRRALMIKCSSILFAIDQSISYQIAHMRYESTLRAKPVAIAAIVLLEDIRRSLFGEKRLSGKIVAVPWKVGFPILSMTQCKGPVNMLGGAPSLDRMGSLLPGIFQHKAGGSGQRVGTKAIEPSDRELQEKMPHLSLLKERGRRRRKFVSKK